MRPWLLIAHGIRKPSRAPQHEESRAYGNDGRWREIAETRRGVAAKTCPGCRQARFDTQRCVRTVVGRLAPHPDEGDKVLFIFDGGTLKRDALDGVRFGDGEISEYAFVAGPILSSTPCHVLPDGS